MINDPSVSEALQWWADWDRFKLLPYGSELIRDEPHFVYEAIAHCENTKSESERETNEKQRAELEKAQKKAATNARH